MYERIRYTLVKWHYSFINSWLNALRKLLYKSLSNVEPKHILIVRKGTLGDIITVLPVFASLKRHFPDSKFSLLTEDYNVKNIGAAEIVDGNTFSTIMRMSDYSPAALSDKMKSLSIDSVIELPQALDTLYTQTRNMLYFRWMCGIRYGAGWQVCTTQLFRKTQLRYHHFTQETERHFQNLNLQIGVALKNSWEYPLIRPTALDKLTAIVDLINFDERPIAAIALGAKHPRKRWPVDRFITIAKRLIENGWQVCWIGNESDSVLLPVNQPGENFCGKLNISETVALMQHINLFIGNDTGPMHLAYACKIPVVALFSMRDYPGKWYPPAHTPHVVLSDKTVPCAICWDKPCSDNICMRNISVDDAWNAIQQLIKNE